MVMKPNIKKVAVMMRVIVQKMSEDSELAMHRRMSKYLSYDLAVTCHVLSFCMKFDDAKQFKEAIVKYSIAEQKSVELIKNIKEFVRAKCWFMEYIWRTEQKERLIPTQVFAGGAYLFHCI